MTTRDATLADHAKLVLEIQDACNLQPILRAWSEAQPVIRATGHGIEGEEHHELHAINIMFLSKVLSLMVVNGDCLGGVEHSGKDLFRSAYEACQKLAGGSTK